MHTVHPCTKASDCLIVEHAIDSALIFFIFLKELHLKQMACNRKPIDLAACECTSDVSACVCT